MPAASEGHATIVQLLLGKRAGVDAKTGKGTTLTCIPTPISEKLAPSFPSTVILVSLEMV